MKQEEPVNVLAYLWNIRVWALWGLLVAVVVGTSGLFLTRTDDESVRAVSLLAVQPVQTPDQAAAVRQSTLFASTIWSISRLTTTEEVLAPVAAATGRSTSDLQGRTKARVPSLSRFVEISYVGTSADDAVATLSAISESLIETVKKSPALSTGDLASTVTVQQPPSTQIEPAIAAELDTLSRPQTSARSSLARLGLVGAGALLAGGATTALLVARQRKRNTDTGEPHSD